ncbi:MAG TPA: response regulator [Polyangiales bacterium]
MSERPESKKSLGRILLQRKVVTADELSELLRQQQVQGARLASTAVQMGKADSADLLSALSEQQGLPAIDLRRLNMPLDSLGLVPLDIARRYSILPMSSEEDRLFLAMADPGDKRVIEEIEFVTGKRVFPYVALQGALWDVIEQAYAAYQAGETHFTGPLAHTPPTERPQPARPSLLPGKDDALVMPGQSLPQDGFQDELSRPLTAPARVEDLSGLTTDSVEIQLPPELLQAGGSQKPRVLVVDDSDDIRQLLVRVFRERDYEVFESARGLDALQKVRACSPDVLVLDAMLPEVHGFDICRRIKGSRRYGHIPVVMVSAVYRGWRFAEDLKRSYGVDEFLEKPFRIGEILAAVQRSLAAKGKAPDLARESERPSGQAADHLKAGIEAYARGDVDQAIGELKKGIAIDPLAFRLHYHLGLLYGKQENVFEAIEALEIAAELRPRDFSTLKNLAVLYQRAGFRLKATEMWERALSSAPDEATRVSIKTHLMSLL